MEFTPITQEQFKQLKNGDDKENLALIMIGKGIDIDALIIVICDVNAVTFCNKARLLFSTNNLIMNRITEIEKALNL